MLVEVIQISAAHVPQFDALEVGPDPLTGSNLMHILWFVSDTVIDVAKVRVGTSQRLRHLDG
jgi:hypothetical protein